MKLVFTVVIFSFYLFMLTSCADLQRSPQSGYAGRGFDSMDFREASLGDISSRPTARAPASQDNQAFKDQMYRKNLETNLKNSEERSQYLRYKPYMTEADKIEFLQLDDITSRERWIQSKNISSNPEKYSRALASLIEQNDIALGMNKEAVRDSWGDPEAVEVSGNERFENERWRFSVPVQTPEGYQIQERQVYFEGGRVVGWTTR